MLRVSFVIEINVVKGAFRVSASWPWFSCFFHCFFDVIDFRFWLNTIVRLSTVELKLNDLFLNLTVFNWFFKFFHPFLLIIFVETRRLILFLFLTFIKADFNFLFRLSFPSFKLWVIGHDLFRRSVALADNFAIPHPDFQIYINDIVVPKGLPPQKIVFLEWTLPVN